MVCLMADLQNPPSRHFQELPAGIVKTNLDLYRLHVMPESTE